MPDLWLLSDIEAFVSQWESTLHGALIPPVSGKLIILDLWVPFRPVTGDSLLFTFFQVTVLLFQSDQLSPNTSQCPLKLISVMWSASQTICRLTIMSLLWQKPHTMGWLLGYSIVFPFTYHPQASGMVGFDQSPQKLTFKDFWLYFPHLLLVYTS